MPGRTGGPRHVPPVRCTFPSTVCGHAPLCRAWIHGPFRISMMHYTASAAPPGSRSLISLTKMSRDRGGTASAAQYANRQ